MSSCGRSGAATQVSLVSVGTLAGRGLLRVSAGDAPYLPPATGRAVNQERSVLGSSGPPADLRIPAWLTSGHLSPSWSTTPSRTSASPRDS